MKNKLLLSLGSSLLVFAPITTVVACGDEPTVDAFSDYVNKIVLTAPTTGTKTIAELDAIVTRTATPVAVGSQQVATAIKDEIGLSAFTINSVNASYAITYDLKVKGTIVAEHFKPYEMKVYVKNTATNITKIKTVEVKSSDRIPTGTNQSALDAYVNSITITDGHVGQNKTIAQLDAIVASSAAGTILDATAVLTDLNVSVAIGTKPSDVTLTYVLTKNSDDAEGSKQSYSLVIKGRTATELVKTKAPHRVVSSENKPISIQTIVNSFTYNELHHQQISYIDGETSANYNTFSPLYAANYFLGNNLSDLHTQYPTVVWQYKITKGTTTPGAPQPYTFEIKATLNSVSASKNIAYSSSDNAPIPLTQQELATYVNTTITQTGPADKTISTLSTYVATNATALTSQKATALGINLGTTPVGVTLTYTLTKGAVIEGSPVNFTLVVIGDHARLTSVSKAPITITSSDNAIHPDQADVDADKAAFVALFGSSYNETTITTVPETTSTTLADAVTPTFTPTNGSIVSYVLSNRVFNITNDAASITVTATFTKVDKTATHTLDVQYGTVKTAMLQLNMTVGDIGSMLPNKTIDKNQTNVEAAAGFTTIENTLPNLNKNTNFNYVVTTITSVAGSLTITITVTHKTIPTITKYTNGFFDGFNVA